MSDKAPDGKGLARQWAQHMVGNTLSDYGKYNTYEFYSFENEGPPGFQDPRFANTECFSAGRWSLKE